MRIISPDEFREVDLLVIYGDGGFPLMSANAIGNIPHQTTKPVDSVLHTFCVDMLEQYKGIPILAIETGFLYLVNFNKGRISNRYSAPENKRYQLAVKSYTGINSLCLDLSLDALVYNLPENFTISAKDIDKGEIFAAVGPQCAGTIWNPLQVNDGGLFEEFLNYLLPKKENNKQQGGRLQQVVLAN